MTIDEIKAEKRELERAILALCSGFQGKTGLIVQRLEVTHYDLRSCDPFGPRQILGDIIAKVDLGL